MQLQKIFFISLVLLGVSTGGYFVYHLSGALFDYLTLKEKTEAHILRWEIKETKGKFPITAVYSFEAGGSVWQGASRLAEPWNLNEQAALAALQGKAKQNWIVWFNPNNPAKSSLERSFPLGLGLRALISFGVIAYFIMIFRRSYKNSFG